MKKSAVFIFSHGDASSLSSVSVDDIPTINPLFSLLSLALEVNVLKMDENLPNPLVTENQVWIEKSPPPFRIERINDVSVIMPYSTLPEKYNDASQWLKIKVTTRNQAHVTSPKAFHNMLTSLLTNNQRKIIELIDTQMWNCKTKTETETLN